MSLSRPFRILSLDGGGVGGVISCVILDKIVRDRPHFLDEVDFIIGTSIGGIQAIALAHGTSPESLIDMFDTKAKGIFTRSWSNIWDLYGPKYIDDGLKAAILSVIPEATKMGELKKSVAVTAFKLSGADSATDSWGPTVFSNEKGSQTLHVPAHIAALATSAAPTFWKIREYQHIGYVDGGVFANNPALLGLSRSVRAKKTSFDNAVILSVGTGVLPISIPSSTAGFPDWGFYSWLSLDGAHGGVGEPLRNLFMDGSVRTTDYILEDLLDKRYRRIQPVLDKTYGLDDADAIPHLKSLTKDHYNSYRSEILEWLDNTWAPPGSRELPAFGGVPISNDLVPNARH